ncbi:MAG: ATP phosphoribosyltransferase regulatory subunit [Candidatus Gottesmanbacteria bacterium]
MKRGPTTPKGFRDIDPELAKKRRTVINKIAEVLETFGFVPIETPTLEFEETLMGKYGDEEKLIYQFTDRGGRKLALRYDLTVPLARFVANNLGLLKPSFSRFQVGQVFRGENPQKGRFREFTQFDFDTVGSTSLEEDAKIISASITSVRNLGLNEAKMLINDRLVFKDLKPEYIRAIDKFYKIGKEGVITEMIANGADSTWAKNFMSSFDELQLTPNLKILFDYLNNIGLAKGKDYDFDPTLARGLDYYTSTIFELKPTGKPDELSIGGGGRYDNLIGVFSGRQIPAVGFSFGLDRLIEFLNN